MIGKTPQADKRSGIRHNEFRIPQSDKCNEEPDPGCSRMLQTIRDAVDDLLANPRNREHKKKNAREKNYAQRRPPGNVHTQANRIREIGVERHSRRESDWIVGIK